MGLTRLAIARPVVILMMVSAFLVLGIVCYFKLPAELNPQVDFPRVTVRTTYSGTNPQEMETLVTKPIEDAISGVSGVQEIDSYSEQGVSTVSVQFYFGTNLDTADADVIQKVDAIRKLLPTASDSPAVLKADTSGRPVMHIAMQSKRRPERELQSLATNLVQPALEQATDVGSVSVAQGAIREIRVSVPASRLAAYGITISQLAQAISNANVNVASGFIQSGSQYYNVRLLGEFASVDEIRNLKLTFSGNSATGGSNVAVGGGAPVAAAGGWYGDCKFHIVKPGGCARRHCDGTGHRLGANPGCFPERRSVYRHGRSENDRWKHTGCRCQCQSPDQKTR